MNVRMEIIRNDGEMDLSINPGALIIGREYRVQLGNASHRFVAGHGGIRLHMGAENDDITIDNVSLVLIAEKPKKPKRGKYWRRSW